MIYGPTSQPAPRRYRFPRHPAHPKPERRCVYIYTSTGQTWVAHQRYLVSTQRGSFALQLQGKAVELPGTVTDIYGCGLCVILGRLPLHFQPAEWRDMGFVPHRWPVYLELQIGSDTWIHPQFCVLDRIPPACSRIKLFPDHRNLSCTAQVTYRSVEHDQILVQAVRHTFSTDLAASAYQMLGRNGFYRKRTPVTAKSRSWRRRTHAC